MPSTDAKWIIGVVIVAFGTLYGALSTQIDNLRSDIAEIRTDIRGMDSRLRAVEVELARVLQRLDNLERRPPAPPTDGSAGSPPAEQ